MTFAWEGYRVAFGLLKVIGEIYLLGWLAIFGLYGLAVLLARLFRRRS